MASRDGMEWIKVCPCGQYNKWDNDECDNCGESIASKFFGKERHKLVWLCHGCGKYNRKKNKTCNNCGNWWW